MLLRELIAEAWSEKYKRSINCANPKGFSQRAHCQGRNKEEDYHPNDIPPGPETKPTMPAGTVRVDVSDVYDWYKLGQHISNLKGLGKHDFGKGAPSTIMAFGSEPEEHKYIKDLEKTGLSTTDIDPADPKQPKGMKRQKVDPTYNVAETKKRKRKKIRRAAYGPGPYGLYGFDNSYSSGTSDGGGGDGGGGGESIKNEFAPAGFGNDKPPRGPKNKGRDPWDNGDSGDDPYSRPDPQYYERSIDYFGKFEADHFDDEVFDEKNGIFKGYWDDEEGRVQIAYFKFDNPKNTGSDDPGMGWYYEPQMESTTENFADGRNPQDKGDSKRHNVPTKGKISTLRKIAKQGGRRGQLAHWMANMKSGRRKTNESREDINIVDALKMFLPIVMHILDLDKLPRIKLHKEIRDTDQPTFGRFLNDDMVIEVGLANRHPNDILRTLAHELVHFKQLLDGEIGPHSGDTGSPQENEANAKAGIIMRVFNKKYPEFLDVKPLMLSETASVGTTSAGNIASVVSPHIAIGNIKSYGKGASASPPKAKQVKNKDGTAKNALDINTNIFGGGAVKR